MKGWEGMIIFIDEETIELNEFVEEEGIEEGHRQ